ncbi:NupC family nucleoside transporter [Spizellomyces punctatus DAOM BR117]|uniref:NupC family nucleoside transporter n=1 Tax=Spizellomyces punctatus (strain DAOM BR117) TaxID=645134 RepID=A0A0L0HBB1_SPIPD|nr:NupC family nucleoside transporter [Spizellomyces punctatus DAOM BR117]KNC98013.1 NupC family nucleoside transporter [Spizellomyces punctatus DAOM BR117]|eukprot:XP_016606053.1 NupC family nucleoside transporter [Spizellomyces punctatus DAOM BR117]
MEKEAPIVEAGTAQVPEVLPEDAIFDEEGKRRLQEEKPYFGKRPARAVAIDLAIWLLMTAYAVAVFVKGKDKDGFHLFTVIWVFVTLRLLARHISMSKLIYDPLGKVWTSTVGAAASKFPSWLVWAALLVATLVGLLLMAIFTTGRPSTVGERLQSWGGVLFFLLIAAGSSRKVKAINLQTVAVGVFFQFIFALIVLRTTVGANIFQWISSFVTGFLKYSHNGLEFLFGPVPNQNFVINVLPAIIFFCAFISIVYYWGGMQYAVQKMGAIMMRLMDTSGAESIVAAASPFVGQVENAMLVLPFIEYMTKSELHAVMTCGFATISGSVLLGYVLIVGDAYLILTACIMSIPASLALTKMRYPEEEESLTKGRVVVPESEDKASNFLHAAANGAATGAQLVILISATILAIVALYQAANGLVGWAFDIIDVHRDSPDPANPGPHDTWISITYILSFVFYPFAWCLGVSANQARLAGEIMAQKLLLNEFVAFSNLGDFNKAGRVNQRTFQLLAFALCGFANLGSTGIQVSALGAISPKRKKDLAELAVSAMLIGNLSTWMTAAVAGCMI